MHLNYIRGRSRTFGGGGGAEENTWVPPKKVYRLCTYTKCAFRQMYVQSMVYAVANYVAANLLCYVLVQLIANRHKLVLCYGKTGSETC